MWFFVGLLTLALIAKLVYDWWQERDEPARVYCLGSVDYAGTVVREVPRMKDQDLLLLSKSHLHLAAKARSAGRTVLVIDRDEDEASVLSVAKSFRLPVADLTHSDEGIGSIMHLLQQHDFLGDTKRYGAIAPVSRPSK